MNPITHGLVSWLVASAAPISRRDRALVTLAGVVPDLDGLGIVAELTTASSRAPLLWWSEYHHVLCHNIGFGIVVVVAAFLCATKRGLTALLALFTFHLHLFGDILGSRGPEGYQ